MPSKMKRIGWVVEFKLCGEMNRKWATLDFSTAASLSRGDAIDEFNDHCHFYFIPAEIQKKGKKYEYLRRKGLARCVPVYMEVDDA